MARHWPRRGDLDVPWRLRLGAWRIPLWRPGCCGKYVEAAQHAGCLGRLPWHDLARNVDPVFKKSRGIFQRRWHSCSFPNHAGLSWSLQFEKPPSKFNTFMSLSWYLMVYYGILLCWAHLGVAKFPASNRPWHPLHWSSARPGPPGGWNDWI